MKIFSFALLDPEFICYNNLGNSFLIWQIAFLFMS